MEMREIQDFPENRFGSVSMKHKQLVSHFLAYMAANPPREDEEGNEPVAMLYGTDEVKINFKREAVRFENREWIPVPGLSQHVGRVEWVAVIPQEDGANVVFGEGPPFGSEAAKHLPARNGRILAAPAKTLAALARQLVVAEEVPQIATPIADDAAGSPPAATHLDREATRPVNEPATGESTASTSAPAAAPASAPSKQLRAPAEPTVCEADPLLRRARLPLFLLAQLRKLRVGEAIVLVNVKGPGLDAGDDGKGRAVCLIEKVRTDTFAVRSLWSLEIGRRGAHREICQEATFKLLTSRRLHVDDPAALSEALKVPRRCEHLAKMAKRAGDREAYSHLSPQLFDAHTRNAAVAPYVQYLDRLALR